MRNPYDAIGRLGLLLAIVGAVNWLLVGLFEWNLVQWIFTQSGTQTVDSVGERVVYIVVGVGGVLAVPMLAATLARARSRSTERTAHDSSDRYVETDDTAYYLGAPKNEREESREPRPLRVAESEPIRAESEPIRAEESTPMRRTERTVVITEEPVTTSSSESPARPDESPGSDRDERLRQDTIAETDEGLDQSAEERRRAA
jgi:uncharacterized protein